ncbi:unnamed protein product [Wuchereria bancrofti]|uniref:Uncharacterized protein n=1 Tax=Wuchereria bancrofti TaxID=6293 RepID=A0A3P7FM36_WUCBA|nr:unnamed protein product [Wuchereria bancrofti]
MMVACNPYPISFTSLYTSIISTGHIAALQSLPIGNKHQSRIAHLSFLFFQLFSSLIGAITDSAKACIFCTSNEQARCEI